MSQQSPRIERTEEVACGFIEGIAAGPDFAADSAFAMGPAFAAVQGTAKVPTITKNTYLGQVQIESHWARAIWAGPWARRALTKLRIDEKRLIFYQK